MLRRHHQGEPADTESDTAPPDPDTESDTPKDAPQPKAAGRSPSRSKTTKGG